MDALNNHGGFLVGPVIVNCESNDNVNCAFSEKFLLVSVTGRWTQRPWCLWVSQNCCLSICNYFWLTLTNIETCRLVKVVLMILLVSLLSYGSFVGVYVCQGGFNDQIGLHN